MNGIQPAPASYNAVPGSSVVVVIVLATVFFVVGANILLVPALLPSVSADLRLSAFMRGALVVALPLSSFIGNIIFGPLIDSIGRRRSLLLGSGAISVFLIATALSTDGTVVVLLRCVTGLLMPLVGISVFPCIAEYIRLDRRVAATGYVMAGGSLAPMITTPAAVVLASHVSWRAVFMTLAVIATVASVCVFVFLPWTRRRAPVAGRSRLGALLPPAIPKVRGSIVTFLLVTFSMFAVTSLYPTWVITNLGGGAIKENAIGVLFLVGGGVATLSALTTGLVARRPKSELLAVIIILPALVVVIMPMFPHVYGVQIVTYALLAGFESLTLPCFVDEPVSWSAIRNSVQ